MLLQLPPPTTQMGEAWPLSDATMRLPYGL